MAVAAAVVALLVGGSSADGSAAVPGSRAAPAVEGATGIGDPYFPEDGNGGIDVLRYDVHDAYRFAGRRLSGWTRLKLRTTERLRSFDLDFLLPVSAVRLSTGPATFDRPDGHELRITPSEPLAAGTTVRVRAEYAGLPQRFRYAGESNWVASDDEVVAMNEPHMSPWWFPADDHPLDKARMHLFVTVPRGRRVIANGTLAGVRRDGARTTYHWDAGAPMAPYLAFFAAGDFAVRSGTSHHLRYEVAVSRQLAAADRRAAMHGLLTTPGIVTWLSRQVGRYPFGVTGGLVTALNPGFALENQTRPTYPHAVNRLLMVHELAHQWFGDSVSVHHWRDVWLNEGFATFMEHLWLADHGGPTTGSWLHQAYDDETQPSFLRGPGSRPGAGPPFGLAGFARGAPAPAAPRGGGARPEL